MSKKELLQKIADGIEFELFILPYIKINSNFSIANSEPYLLFNLTN